MRNNSKLRSRALRYVNAVHAAGSMLDAETRAVLIALGSHLNQEDWLVWPSVRRLATMTELSERTVKRRRAEIIRDHKLAQDMGGYYGERRNQEGELVATVEERNPRAMRKWRKGGRPPLCLKLDLVALLKFRRGRIRESPDSGDTSLSMVTASPVAKVTGGPETSGGLGDWESPEVVSLSSRDRNITSESRELVSGRSPRSAPRKETL